MSSTSWLPQAAGGPANFCWPPGAVSSLHTHPSSPSFPRVFLAAFPLCPGHEQQSWRAGQGHCHQRLSQESPACWRSLSHPTPTVLHLWLLRWEWQREALVKNLYDPQRAFTVQKVCLPCPCAPASGKAQTFQGFLLANPLPRNQQSLFCSAAQRRGRQKVIMSLLWVSHNLLWQLNSHGLLPRSSIYLTLNSQVSLHTVMLSFAYERTPNLISAAVKFHFKVAYLIAKFWKYSTHILICYTNSIASGINCILNYK